MFIVGVPSATAVHDLGLFELDENAEAQATPGDDWETIAGGGSSALLDTFVTDPVETSADDIFDGGQTKDTENLDEWLWKGGEPNDKNDIEHAFAAPTNIHLRRPHHLLRAGPDGQQRRRGRRLLVPEEARRAEDHRRRR